MARGEKPYRVYRGGRAKGKVPTGRPSPEERRSGDGRLRAPREGRRRTPRRRTSWGRRILLALVLALVLLIVWAVASYLAVSDGVKSANDRLNRRTKAALVPQEGLLLSRATNILLVGTDSSGTRARAGNRHSDSMLLLRTDPERHRLAYLSILRDLRVEIPGFGTNKVNAAFQFGGAPLAIRTVRQLTGLPVHHLVVVNFASFRELIDELGGITVDIPKAITSNRFDCPFATQAQCARWTGWRFSQGRQHLDGQRALVYSRIRKNQLDPSESDATRAARQQQVLEAIAGRLTSPRTLARLPFIGGDLLAPITTDLTAGEFMQLAWVRFRAGRTLHCRLGGDSFGGYILPDEERFVVLQMVQGRAAPQPPRPGAPYGSGCLTGGPLLGG